MKTKNTVKDVGIKTKLILKNQLYIVISAIHKIPF